MEQRISKLSGNFMYEHVLLVKFNYWISWHIFLLPLITLIYLTEFEKGRGSLFDGFYLCVCYAITLSFFCPKGITSVVVPFKFKENYLLLRVAILGVKYGLLNFIHFPLTDFSKLWHITVIPMKIKPILSPTAFLMMEIVVRWEELLNSN